MGSRKPKRHRNGTQKGATKTTQDDSRFIFEALVSVIKSPEVLNPAILKRLYVLLSHLCSNAQCRWSNGVESSHLEMEISNDSINVTTKDIERLSNVLFEELSQRFKQFFIALCDDSSKKGRGNGNSVSDMRNVAQIVNLLLRCCLLVLTLLQPLDLRLEKGQVLLGIVRSLTSLHLNMEKGRKGIMFKRSVSLACEKGESDHTTSTEDFIASLHYIEPSDSHITLVSAMLEVILDELLVNGELRPLFRIIDSLSATCGKLLSSYSGVGDPGLLMEIISSHFSLAFSEKHAVEFLDRLFRMHKREVIYSFRATELSQSAAALLLLNPILLSSPKFMQAHVIALISEATSNVMDLEIRTPDCEVMKCFLSVLEKSVVLYAKHMFSLQIDCNFRSTKCSIKSTLNEYTSQPSFESVILPYTRKKINYLITKLDDSSESCMCNMSYETKSDLMSSSIRYIKECHHLFDKSCEDEILSILSCIILRASDSFDDAASHAIQVGGLEDFCFLASVMKLMSNSLLQVIWCLRHSGDSNYPKSLRDFSSCKDYDSILSIISCFKEFSINHAIQQWLCNMMESNSTRHSNSKMMFLHFAGLLSFAFSTRLDFLVKGCLLSIISLMNLFIFEEGNLDLLHSFVCSSSEYFPSEMPSVNIQEGVVDHQSSLVVASKFQKIRTLFSSTSSLASHFKPSGDRYPRTVQSASVLGPMVDAIGTEEEIEESSNGELFLRCVLKNNEIVSDFNDLADFIECKKGKDYSGWLKDREKYRKWKGEKMAVLRWKRKKKTWRVVKSKKN